MTKKVLDGKEALLESYRKGEKKGFFSAESFFAKKLGREMFFGQKSKERNEKRSPLALLDGETRKEPEFFFFSVFRFLCVFTYFASLRISPCLFLLQTEFTDSLHLLHLLLAS